MSTRYIKRDNVRIIGLAKNASQSLKQVAIHNDNWKLHNEDVVKHGKDAVEKFVNHYNKDVVVYFPIRDERERAKSELLEYISKHLLNQHNGESITVNDVRLFLHEDFKYHPRFEYFRNETMKVFLEEILHNNDWNGCRVKFFDLKKMTSHLPQHLGYSDTEIPFYNVGSGENVNDVKRVILEYLTDEIWEERKGFIFNKEWLSYYIYISQPFWKGIKKSKHWLEL